MAWCLSNEYDLMVLYLVKHRDKFSFHHAVYTLHLLLVHRFLEVTKQTCDCRTSVNQTHGDVICLVETRRKLSAAANDDKCNLESNDVMRTS
jgi:hypothetical protein